MDVRTQLIGFEGFVQHAYQDSLGYWTIGVGRLIDERKNGGLTKPEVEMLLDNDITRIRSGIYLSLPWALSMNEARQAVLINMSFQMGLRGLLGFTSTLGSMRDERYADAAEGMRQSLWAKQTGDRARRLAYQMDTGEWQ